MLQKISMWKGPGPLSALLLCKGRAALRLLLHSCSSSGQAVPLLVTATQLCEASVDHMQLSFSAGTAQSVRLHVDVEFMKSQLIALSKKLVPTEVINPPLLVAQHLWEAALIWDRK